MKIRSRFSEDLKYTPGPSYWAKASNADTVWVTKNGIIETVSTQFLKIEDANLNISSKRFDQAFQYYSRMLVGQLHLLKSKKPA
jgi:hypothetical protein